MTEPTLEYVKGKGWVYDYTESFVTKLANGKEVTCYYRRPQVGEWYTNFGAPGITYTTVEGRLTDAALRHINGCLYGYGYGRFGWREGERYDEGHVYVTIIPVEGYANVQTR